MGYAIARAAVVAIALVVVAWLAFGLRSASLAEQGEETYERAREGPVSPADVQEAQDALRRARRLSLDRDVLATEALLLSITGRREEGAAIARELASEEPQNVRSWFAVYGTAPTPAGVNAARERVRRLNPWLGDQLTPAPE
jgi:hypothetical protein